ncbi:DUF5722 domain-containing protein [Alienimonas californiensis]|uniref:DUF5722 domain-containing protein n=1 Tax=Alienimonas californiensis TaxID=2527989 RepID=A0A517PF57_9PLAN|nr:DUF5722 domain-containing protein [Alienimonas californiensis]QDT18002.1 hypothetical protein CA12_41400 [Alienimonas californiensis]
MLNFAPLLLILCGSSDVPLTLDAATAHDLTLVPIDGGATLTTTGADPYVQLRPFDPAAVGPDAAVLEFEYLCPDGVEGLHVYYGRPFAEARSIAAGPLTKAEGWARFAVNLRDASAGRWTAETRELRLDFGARAGVQISVRGLRLRPRNEAERRSAEARQRERDRKLRDAAAVQAVLNADLPSSIGEVIAEPDEILIAGHADRPATLLEIFPWVPTALRIEAANAQVVGEVPAGPFEVRLPRTIDAADPVTSRWAVARRTGEAWELESAAIYSTTIAARHELERLTPRSIKGLGGISDRGPRSDWTDLGLHNVTINVPLGQFVSLTPGPDRTPFPHAGRTWYAEDSALRRYDALIGPATEQGIVVSAILLITFAQNDFNRTLIHPEAVNDGAAYAMPNLATADGVAAYGAVIALLSDRYARPADGSAGESHGRIVNWILHNEIDQGAHWTNMGEQPPLRYLETYYRAMRLVHALTRRNDPHARTFVSLTHHWDQPPDPTWETYAPKRLLEDLAALSRLEGDFEWGVAYHPYPESLLRPTPWSDRLPTDRDDTPMITPRNLAVLDRFLHRPELRFRPSAAERTQGTEDRVRGVLLSEQGFHTPETTDPAARAEHERVQAAAFLYTWDRLRELTVVEAFHNHRWIDHPGEGPLRLGLRRQPTAEEPDGPKKLAWEVYRDLGTPEESRWRWLLDEVGAPGGPGSKPTDLR